MPTTAKQMRRILLIEDNSAVRDLLAKLLTDAGHAVTAVSRSETFDAEPPNLVILDLGGTDGLEFLRAKAASPSWRAVPVVIFTGTKNLDVGALPNSETVKRVLVKPAEPDALLEVVREIVG